MPLTERGRAILAIIERDLPSRKAFAGRSFAEKLDFLDRLKAAADEHERICAFERTESEQP